MSIDIATVLISGPFLMLALAALRDAPWWRKL